MCEAVKYQIQIINKLPSDERINKGSMDHSWTQIRKTKKTKWIKRLSTDFPYGLTDKEEEYHLHTTKVIGLKFPLIPRSHLNVRGIKHQIVNQLSGREFLCNLSTCIFEGTLNAMNFTRNQKC